MGVTIHDVAKRAGVSPATVSRVLNDRPGIRAETRERVLKAAREPRHSLSSHSFYGQVLAAAEKEARQHGYHLLFSTVHDEAPLMLEEQRVEGLILAGCDIPRALILHLKHSGVPFVLVDNHLPGVNSIVIDNEGGAYEAVSHLIRLGHREIGFLCEWMEDLSWPSVPPGAGGRGGAPDTGKRIHRQRHRGGGL